MLGALQKLQTIYNDACKTGNVKQVVIERPTFEAIGTALKNAYKQITQAPVANERNHVIQSENIEERLSCLEKTIKETFASTKTWAQIAVAPASEPDHLRNIH